MANFVAVEQLDKDTDFEFFLMVTDNLKEVTPESSFYKNLSSRVNAMRSTAIGQMAPEIILPDLKGEEVKLSDTRGQYVLLDFWASWCKPCRAESPNLVKAYEKYQSKGFTIFSVSLDGLPQQGANSANLWNQAIVQDKLNWKYHASDLKGWQSSAGQAYNVRSIPFSLLIDKDGKIIAKNLRGQSLQAELSSIFGF